MFERRHSNKRETVYRADFIEQSLPYALPCRSPAYYLMIKVRRSHEEATTEYVTHTSKYIILQVFRADTPNAPYIPVENEINGTVMIVLDRFPRVQTGMRGAYIPGMSCYCCCTSFTFFVLAPRLRRANLPPIASLTVVCFSQARRTQRN